MLNNDTMPVCKSLSPVYQAEVAGYTMLCRTRVGEYLGDDYDDTKSEPSNDEGITSRESYTDRKEINPGPYINPKGVEG